MLQTHLSHFELYRGELKCAITQDELRQRELFELYRGELKSDIRAYLPKNMTL